MSTLPQQDRVPVEQRLNDEPVAWLSSIRPDGRPHVVPIWFLWDGQVIDFFSKPAAQKVRNLQFRPEVMLAVGDPDEEWDVELVEGRAVVLERPTSEVLRPAMIQKYSPLMARAGLDTETYSRVYSQPVRITPTRFVGYGGKGWTGSGPGEPIDTGQDVAGHAMRTDGAGVGVPPADVLAAISRAAQVLRLRGPSALLALEE
jgi:PPOX class probable F420-dependent enzyme